MTTLREAAQQALEAWDQPHGINYTDFRPYMDALKAALVEDAMHAPPQRKPLSDTELARIWDDALDQLDPRDQLRFVARAIERAHGITP